MTTLTIEIPDRIDLQLQVNGLTHQDLTELFLHWVQTYLNEPDSLSSTSSETNTASTLVQQNNKNSLSSILGRGQGSFSTPEEADAFIRAERDAWTS